MFSFFGREGGSGGASLGRVPRLERAVPRWMKWAKINRVNSKSKLLKSPENNFDIHIFINPKESINITDIHQYRVFFGSKNIDIMSVSKSWCGDISKSDFFKRKAKWTASCCEAQQRHSALFSQSVV